MARLLPVLLLAAWGCGASLAPHAPSIPQEEYVEMAPEITSETGPLVEVTAHRGASTVAPENTMAAFRRALEEGAHRIELDVRLTRDGHIIALHDPTLERTTNGEGEVAELELADIEQLDAGSWMDEEFSGEPVPLLTTVLAWAADRIALNIELKTDGNEESATPLAGATVELIERFGLEESVQISSFDVAACTEAARLCPRCEVALLWNGRGTMDPIAVAEALGARAVHLPLGSLERDLATRAHALSIVVRVYTVNSEEELLEALHLGADGVITDIPEEALRWLEGQQNSRRTNTEIDH